MPISISADKSGEKIVSSSDISRDAKLHFQDRNVHISDYFFSFLPPSFSFYIFFTSFLFLPARLFLPKNFHEVNIPKSCLRICSPSFESRNRTLFCFLFDEHNGGRGRITGEGKGRRGRGRGREGVNGRNKKKGRLRNAV